MGSSRKQITTRHRAGITTRIWDGISDWGAGISFDGWAAKKHRKMACLKLGIRPGLNPESVPHQKGDGSQRRKKKLFNLDGVFMKISNPKLTEPHLPVKANFSVNGRDYPVEMSFAMTEPLPKGIKICIINLTALSPALLID